MISLSNTSFGGKSIFAGQEVDKNAYEAGLMVYDKDGSVDPYVEAIVGSSDRSVKVQFLGDGTKLTTGDDDIDYRYTRDGGKSWKTGTVSSTGNKLDLGGGLSVTLRDGYVVTGSSVDNENTDVGTWLTVAPTAVYTGGIDDQSAVTITGGAAEDFHASTRGSFEQDVEITIDTDNRSASPPEVTYRYTSDGETFPPGAATFSAKVLEGGNFEIELPSGQVTIDGSGDASGLQLTVHAATTPVLQMGSNVNARGEGEFDRPIMVRIDNDSADFTTVDYTIEYSYSLDGGRSWMTGKEAANEAVPPDPPTPPELLVPGGSLKLAAKDGNDDLKEGDQFIIQPKLADLSVDISADNRVAINNMGSDIFGGSLQYGTGYYHSQDEEGSNLFVTMGKLIASLENNDQSGIAEALEGLGVAQNRLMNQAADVGSRENRLAVTKNILSGLQLNQEERMSNIEDVDIAELMTDLNKQEIVYQAVLTSSSKIMKMSLLNYI
jgi:flagellar hook-associated protein 3 FlgL